MLNYIIIIIIAYLLGNISTSYIVAKQLSGVDIRTQGSGNAGSTNVLRTLGKKAGALTFIGDVLKGLIAVLIAKMIAHFVNLDETTCAYLAVVAVVLGHNYPVFLGFKGGRGVATGLGVLIALSPIVAVICFAIWGIIVYFTKLVSLGSIVAAALVPVLMYVMGESWWFVGFGALAALFVIIRHRENISRLLAGKELKVERVKKGE